MSKPPNRSNRTSARIGRQTAHRLSPLIRSYRREEDWPAMDVDLATTIWEILDTLSVPHDVIVDTLDPAATWYLKHRASLRWGLGPDPL